MIHLTIDAARTLRMALGENGKAAGVRLMVRSGGCAGMRYLIGLVESADPRDLSLDCEGIAFFVEPGSAGMLSGTTIDFVSDADGAGFRFDNPNASHLCSCGKSFG